MGRCAQAIGHLHYQTTFVITNILTYAELEKIILPILKLEDIVIIKENIYKVLHFTRGKTSDKQQYIINSQFTGIASLYRGFEFQVRGLDDAKNNYKDVLLRFTKKKVFLDYFKNSKNRIVRELKEFCKREIQYCSFNDFSPVGVARDGVKDEFFYQTGTKNPDWEKHNKLSPLTIFTKEDSKEVIIEFLFAPFCYQRTLGKTVLKANAEELFRLNSPSW